MMFVITLFMIMAPAAQATVRCGEALMSLVVDGQEHVESTQLCVQDEQREGAKARVQAIASANCRTVDGEKPCLALRKAQEAAHFVRRTKKIAPNGFDLCLRLGGTPESIKFQMTPLGVGVWHMTDRCRFDLDFSFLDTLSFSGSGPFAPGKVAPE